MHRSVNHPCAECRQWNEHVALSITRVHRAVNHPGTSGCQSNGCVNHPGTSGCQSNGCVSITRVCVYPTDRANVSIPRYRQSPSSIFPTIGVKPRLMFCIMQFHTRSVLRCNFVMQFLAMQLEKAILLYIASR